MAVELNQNNFNQEVLNSKGVTLVDFWAPWCGPCQRQLPIVEELGKEIKNEAKVAKVNVDENPGLSASYQVVSVPTLMIFKNGEVVQKLMGVHSKEQLKDAIKKNA